MCTHAVTRSAVFPIDALAGHPEADLDELLDLVYGLTVPTSMRGASAPMPSTIRLTRPSPRPNQALSRRPEEESRRT